MDASRSPNSLYYRTIRVTPKKSPTTESVQKRRRDLEKSEKAAYWALFNTSLALILYCDLCYLRVVSDISILSIVEWLFCFISTLSACYHFTVHFWAHTFMKPLQISSLEKRLNGIQEDEFGFEVKEPKPVKPEQHFENLPPYEIHYSFEEEEKIVTPQKKQHSPDSSINTSRRSRIVDKESLVEYLKNCRIIEDEMAELREADSKQNHC